MTTTYGDVANMVISLPPSGAPGTGRQQHHLEGMPFGTRGGFIVEHNFPADGEYELTIGDMALAREVPRMEFENTVIALLDGKEFYRTTIGGEADHKAIDQRLDPAVEEINGRLRKIRFKATAGQHKLAVTFLHRSFAESDERTRTIALEGGQERIQAAHALQIRGPLSVTGMSESASRAKIFICQPTGARATKRPARSKIVENLARRAFRRPVTAEDLNPLMAFYKAGYATAGFEGGVRDALSAILASPHFLYRAESGDAAGGTRTLSDLELASRLSFFLWSSLPDDELLKLATESRLSKPDVLAATGEPDARRPAGQVAERRFRVPVAPPRQAGRDHPGPRPVPARERPAGSARDVQGRAAAVHRQRPAQRSQRDRAADRGLHLPQRAPGDALRHRDGQGQPLPSRDARRTRRATACWARARS